MRYLMLIYGDESAFASASPEEQAAALPAWNAYTERHSDVFLGGDALQVTATATTVRVRDGETLLTDGPFAETREQLGGYYLMECDSLDTALEVAADCPGAAYGSVEVRPVMVFPG
jgi:hypothetical protein